MEHYLYMAGPISDCSFGEVTDWRKYVQTKLPSGIIGISPMRFKDYLRDEKSIHKINPHSNLLSSAPMIVARDRMDVKRSTAVLMNLLDAKVISIGSMIETGWIDAYQKPLIICMKPEDRVHNHMMLNTIASCIVSDLDEAIDLAIKIILPR